MNFTIRQETKADHDQITALIQSAFANAEHSDQQEHILVSKLRSSPVYVPELALVAEDAGQIVGHILFTRVRIQNANHAYAALVLAPVSVAPEAQKQGIGRAMIAEGHRIATALGYEAVIVLGHTEYYPQLGYERASKYHIEAPFKVPDESYLVKELKPGALAKIRGLVKYAPEFGN